MLKLILAHKKIVAGLAGLAALTAFTYAMHNNIYEKGVLDERTRLQAEYNRQFEQQRQQYERNLSDRIQAVSDDYKEQLEVARENVRIEYITKEVTEYVYREIEVPVGCDKLASDIIGVLKQATRIARGAANTSTSSTD